MTAGIHAAAHTDVGRVRERNEDAYFTSATVFAVADGLGGHRAGEVASNAALEPLDELSRKHPGVAARELAQSVRAGNRTVYERAQADPDLRGMGTTMTAVAIHDGTARLAHVGDSRCYLIRAGNIRQLTEDHTVVARLVAEGRLTREEADTHPQRSLLLRALGAEEAVEVDEREVRLQPGDRLLLCSDGLTGVLADPEILQIASFGDDLDETCRRLVDEANARGGPDNITVVLVEVDDEAATASAAAAVAEAPGADSAGRPRRRAEIRAPRVRVPTRALVWALVGLAAILTVFFVLRSVVSQSYYVGLEGCPAGRTKCEVVIYRGLPSGGIKSLSSIERRTGITLDRVPPRFHRSLREGIRAKSLDDAEEIVAGLERDLAGGSA